MDPKLEEENVKAAANVFRGPSTEHRTMQPVKYDPKLRGSLRASRSRNNGVAGPKATEPKTATISDDDKAREDEESKARARWLADYIMSTKDIYD
ncbi:hypothetical protein KJ359_005149 [Pestalotiopsis sp. 9143b]|nr:hypothetical protein KJ359_005149 [Pestalotiopsis sp. 9143b]